MAPYAVLDARSTLKQGNEDKLDHRTSQTPLLHSSLPLTRPSSSRSSHHSVTSHGSSQSSLYLSPPVTDSETEIGPYKPGDHDNTSLNMHVNRKRRKKAVHRRKDQPAALGYPDKPCDQLTLANHICRRDPAAGSWRSYSSLSDDSGSYGPMELGQNNSTNAIDHASSADCGKTNRATPRRWSVVGGSVILSPPSARACAGDVVEKNASLSARIGFDDSARTRNKREAASSVNSCAYWNDNRRRISTNGSNAETPATITLRKASNTYHHENSRRYSQSARSRIVKRPMAKDGKPIGFLPGERLANTPQGDSTISSSHHSGLNEVFAVSLVSLRSGTLLSTSASSSDQLTLRRRTNAAGPALTFAEVHTTPEVFSPGGASRKHSQLAINTMRRSSTVMICSGSSVHEIIWDKDDAPSSSSSRPSISQTGSGSSSERRSLAGSPRKTSIEHNHFQNLDFSESAFGYAEVSSNTDGAHALQEVAGPPWTSKQAQNNLESMAERTAIQDAMQSEMPSRSMPKRAGRWSKSWRASSSNSMQGVESFPPLLERGSTYEWRKAPLVNIDDPTAGQSAPSVSASRTNSETTNEAQEQQTNPTPRKQSCTAHHGPRTNNHLGTGLGTSSHHRRASTGPHLPGPYSSLVDLSKSVSRRASQITHSLSDKALDWAADRHEPRRSSKSADPLSHAPVADSTQSQRDILSGSPAAQRIAPVWRKKSNGGLWINTASVLPDARVPRVGGLSEVAEDEVEYRAEGFVDP
ncbi:hypothetical protein MMC15_005911 [Xylographa vitiligo]|nr:hypothetical protein [Xylographa vitiligo]